MRKRAMPHADVSLFGFLPTYDPSRSHMTFLSEENEGLCALRDEGHDDTPTHVRKHTEECFRRALNDMR